MIVEALHKLLIRDLNKLRAEISLYRREDNLWHIEQGIANSAGNLCLHLIGNLNGFIGAVLGNTGYVRNREAEFTLNGIPKEKLLSMIDDTMTMIHEVCPKLSAADLEKEFPVLVFEQKTSTAYMLIHLSGHLDYHLGQINYHRRLLDHR